MQYLIDASVYVFRAYYSIPDDMVDDAGNPINALYGFCRFIGDFMAEFKALELDKRATLVVLGSNGFALQPGFIEHD